VKSAVHVVRRSIDNVVKTKIIPVIDPTELLGISGVYYVVRISAGVSARIVWRSQQLPNSCFADFGDFAKFGTF
jgi:hypothetical protein